MKYVVARTDGTAIPLDEPCWVFRARDVLALPAIFYYRALAQENDLPSTFIADIDAHIQRINRWQTTYGTKQPD